MLVGPAPIASTPVPDGVNQTHTLPGTIRQLNIAKYDFLLISVESLGRLHVLFRDSVLWNLGLPKSADIEIIGTEILPTWIVADDVVGREVKPDLVDVAVDTLFAEHALGTFHDHHRRPFGRGRTPPLLQNVWMRRPSTGA